MIKYLSWFNFKSWCSKYNESPEIWCSLVRHNKSPAVQRMFIFNVHIGIYLWSGMPQCKDHIYDQRTLSQLAVLAGRLTKPHMNQLWLSCSSYCGLDQLVFVVMINPCLVSSGLTLTPHVAACHTHGQFIYLQKWWKVSIVFTPKFAIYNLERVKLKLNLSFHYI